ncbi:SRPBCC family protein [Actinocrispum sp. NPDC049592]|uniref:SRPBCC family protein n=1 Tax=Actinocrispum sp. NPDC049592 TaxID=3154835 RepID=UPI00344A55E0
MAGQFEASVEIDRPVEEVFAYLADGTNDPQFSPRVLRITKEPAGETAVGTVFTSTVKDAGMKTNRQIKITEFVPNTKLRWTETSKNIVTSKEGGYDFESLEDGRTRLRIFNELEGHGFGKLIVGFALSQARKDAPAFGRRIKTAAEAAISKPADAEGTSTE